MDIQGAQQSLLSVLTSLYPDREAAVITDWVLENITGRKKIDRLINKNNALSPAESDLLHRYSTQLQTHRPVQYVLHESWFAGMKFYVDERVLIPRPETEELVEWVVEMLSEASQHSGILPASGIGPSKASDIGPSSSSASTPAILDIGTGSGCIAIALQKSLPWARVTACDISEDALAVARRNAAALGVDLNFLHLDILDPVQRDGLPPFDCIVSNPPYIPLQDKTGMAPHVLQFEPHMALFVEDHDPLLFYRAIASLAVLRLSADGAVFVEIHEELAAPVQTLFREYGLQNVIIKKDMQGKDRMISATR